MNTQFIYLFIIKGAFNETTIKNISYKSNDFCIESTTPYGDRFNLTCKSIALGLFIGKINFKNNIMKIEILI